MNEALLGYRKIIAAGIILSCGIGAFWLKGDVPPGFLTLLQTLFAAFVVGNGVEHVSRAVCESRAANEEEAPDNGLQELKDKMEKVDAEVTTSNQALSGIQTAINFIIDRAGFNKPR